MLFFVVFCQVSLKKKKKKVTTFLDSDRAKPLSFHPTGMCSCIGSTLTEFNTELRCLIVVLLTEKIQPAVATSFSEYLHDLKYTLSVAPGTKTTKRMTGMTLVQSKRLVFAARTSLEASSVRSCCKAWDAYETHET